MSAEFSDIPSAPAELGIGGEARDPWLDYVQPEAAPPTALQAMPQTPYAIPQSQYATPLHSMPHATPDIWSVHAVIHPPKPITGHGTAITALVLAILVFFSTVLSFLGVLASTRSSTDGSIAALMLALIAPLGAATFATAIIGFSIGVRTRTKSARLMGGIALGLSLVSPVIGVMTFAAAYG